MGERPGAFILAQNSGGREGRGEERTGGERRGKEGQEDESMGKILRHSVILIVHS